MIHRIETKHDSGESLWMIPYADLMSTLTILFLALFAYSYQNKSPEYDRALAAMQNDLNKEDARTVTRLRESEMAVDMKKILDGLALQDFGVNVTSSRINLTLPSPVLFAEGSARLSPEAKDILGKLSPLIAGTSNPVLVNGHTDDIPIVGGRYRSNAELSAARAFTVIEYFIHAGLDPARFAALGYGEHRPTSPNTTVKNRRRNRRIEITLIRSVRRET